jgi:menaquinone-dependent protoporphyrinogen oxidase
VLSHGEETAGQIHIEAANHPKECPGFFLARGTPLCEGNHMTEEAKVLVTAGSKHGATAEIAGRIGSTLESEGCAVTVLAPEDVERVDGYDAIVLGSAVYAGHWTADAKDLANRVALLDDPPPVWLFSSGPVGDPPQPEEEPVDVSTVMNQTGAREHHVFAGKIDRSKLSFGEKAIVIAVRAAEGDFRDWDAIDAWARNIANALTMEASTK